MPNGIGPSPGLMENSIKKIRGENPDLANTSIEPVGWLGRMLMGSAEAITNPWTGNVSYDPNKMQQLSPNENENILTHELTHARQVGNTPYLQRLMGVGRSMLGMDDSYYDRPRELEAFQSERNRTLSQKLPDMKDPVTGRGDIQLTRPKRRNPIAPSPNVVNVGYRY
jgi:hypothetical protein